MTSRDDSPVFALHRGGKIEIVSKVPLRDRDDLSLAYTPGVAEVCLAIAAEPDLVNDYTWKSSVVAVVTDGTAVLGLGNIGPEASLPVMEGKALLFKQFGGVDAVPIALDCTEVDELVETVDPAGAELRRDQPRGHQRAALLRGRGPAKAALDIPVFHDDQHGTAIVALAAMQNAARLTGRSLGDLRAVVSGAGAAGVAVTKILIDAGIGDIAIADSKGIVHAGRDRPQPDQGDDGGDHQLRRLHRLDRRRDGGRRRLHRAVGRKGRGGGRRQDGAGVDDLRDGQPGARDPSRHRPPLRPRRRDRPQ